MHLHIKRNKKKWAKRVECSYVSLDMLQEILPPKTPRPYIGEGIFYFEAPYGNEWIIIRGARTVFDYKTLLPQFFDWYNNKRPHQALRYKFPASVLEALLCGYVDKADALPHIPTKASSTTIDSLIFV